MIMKLLLGLMALLNLIVLGSLIVTAFWFSPMEQLRREEATRGLFASQSLSAPKINRYLARSGSEIRITGTMDEIGDPSDDWMEFARKVLYSESPQTDKGMGIAILASGASLFSFILIAGILVLQSVLRWRHRCTYPRVGLSAGTACPECGSDKPHSTAG